MNSVFTHLHPYTIGVEEEYMICDPHNGNLINRANEIINSLSKEYKERFSYELILAEIESNTPICKDVSTAVSEISKLRKILKNIGKQYDFKIGISGTHPTALSIDQNFVQNDSYQWVAKQLSYYAKRNMTFAIHVHIAIENEELAVKATNALRQWIAPLLAISTNSPYFEGEETGIRSSRTMQFGNFPRTNIPSKFDSFRDYVDLVEKYVEINTIKKSRQIWWKIRPHLDYGTIEFRMCDMQRSLKKVRMLIAICQSLVYQTVIDIKSNKAIEDFNLEFLNDALWKATRFSLNAKIIDPVTNKVSKISEQILKMKEYISNALKFFGNQNVEKEIDNIIQHGTECDEQLKITKASNLATLKKYLMDSVEYE